jgi:cell division protein FtsB
MRLLSRLPALLVLTVVAVLLPRALEGFARHDELHEQQSLLEALRQQNEEQEARKVRLRSALHAHATDVYTLEARARHEHSLILPDEEILVFEGRDEESHARLALPVHLLAPER